MLGIVLLNYKNYQETISCVKQLQSQIRKGDRIYVVDNCSPNNSFEELQKELKNLDNVEVIESGKNGGFSYGNNVGFRKAVADGCEELLCSNSDIEFYAGCIEELRKALYRYEYVAVVGPKIYTKDGGLQMCNKTKLTPFRFLMHHKPFVYLDWFGINKKYALADYQFDKELVFQGMVSGCCFMIKTSVLEQIGYLDENVFLYHEEDILAAKLEQIDMKTMIEPSAEIVHWGSGTIGAISPFTRYCTFASGLYYLWNYAHASKFAMRFILFVTSLMFGFYSLKDKEYSKYKKQLKKEVKDLLRSKRMIGE